MGIAFILLGLVLLLLGTEALLLGRTRRAIPVRILVLGTRGKTTVTEYIAAGLRASGRRTLAKTTGSRPTLILPDGRLERLRRRGKARVHEQWGIMRRARRLRCDALVLECMSVSPELQMLESRVLHPTLAVLTNILDDHQEVYGDNESWRVQMFASTLPAATELVSGERRHAETIRRAAFTRRSTVTLSPASLSHDPPDVPREANEALAVAALERLGLPVSEARAAIRALSPPHLYREIALSDGEQALRLLNAFAVNDVESASSFLEEWKRRLPEWERTVILFNTRSDRPLRSLQFARWCATVKDTEAIILLGTHIPRTRREFLGLGVQPGRLMRWNRRQIARPLEALRPFAASGTVCVGVGNVAGDGARLLEAAGMQ